MSFAPNQRTARRRRLPLTVPALAGLLLVAAAIPAKATMTVIAAENVYGDIARQVGGEDADVSSILANPDQDPHLFEVSPSVARAVANAQTVIYNGIGYDPWMERLLAASRAPSRQTVDVAALAGYKLGDNPHIWYLPDTMSRLADTLAADYQARDPLHASAYAQRLAIFQTSLVPVRARIAALRQRLQGIQVTATEPVFGVMFAALGMIPRNTGFQRAVMNETEAGASEVAGFETDLRSHRVRLLVFNSQASDVVADRMKAIAIQAGVPILGVTETEPAGTRYQAWIMGMLRDLDRAIPDVR